MAGVKWTAELTHVEPGPTNYHEPGAMYLVKRNGDVVEEDLTLDDLFAFLDGVMEQWQTHLVWWAAWLRWAPMEIPGESELLFQHPKRWCDVVVMTRRVEEEQWHP